MRGVVEERGVPGRYWCSIGGDDKRRMARGGGGGRIIELISYLKVPTLVQYSTELTLRVTYSVPTLVF